MFHYGVCFTSNVLSVKSKLERMGEVHGRVGRISVDKRESDRVQYDVE